MIRVFLIKQSNYLSNNVVRTYETRLCTSHNDRRNSAELFQRVINDLSNNIYEYINGSGGSEAHLRGGGG